MNSKRTVLVTGGTGYLAKWVIVGLLREGYGVRATLRNLHKESEVRTAMTGCQYVLHVASPIGQGAPKGTDIVTPAREGTLTPLGPCRCPASPTSPKMVPFGRH
jgi:dihydroflavonol-4-reductase